MELVVQKFGGTSLTDEQSRSHVLRHIIREYEAGGNVVVVVSAMGRSGDAYATDSLLELIRRNGDSLPEREKDLLLSCGELISAAVLCSLLRAEGIPAVALTGGQAGIVTDGNFGSARIVEIDCDRIHRHLSAKQVVIVTGFQGMTRDGEMTTLGRGGSDTSATALGAALKADIVDIYTDVDGILTADPRWVANARPLAAVSYEEICNMAQNGAKVIHPRAVELAMKAGIPVRVRSTFSDGEGTLVTYAQALRSRGIWYDKTVTGLAHVRDVTQLAVTDLDGPADLQLRVFRAMASHGISVDFINVMPTGVHYTVSEKDTPLAVKLLRELGFEPRVRRECAKVSVIGGGMNGEPGVMAVIVEALTDSGIPILQSADSNTTIWVLIAQQDLAAALQALHTAFGLHLSPVGGN
ncbi:aspartate kinase [Cohnella sp. CIP 111063]|jgi:aspartate kinase, monofunctional class|uniref:aspartate kinase n=1 Tax=unclassified Cohnella TaxID=2636738 RepID=UPI000B8C4185|nr:MULTISPECIES: aspartate kinase [unclassified Cohnella]OXS59730.1 aspartate kinase [Cohnella sp. CIP 111063]PRX72521.1 aspartate kinase [Cohnella sp. SGD-V74]